MSRTKTIDTSKAFKLGRLWPRFLASVIDGFIVSLPLSLFIIVLFLTNPSLRADLANANLANITDDNSRLTNLTSGLQGFFFLLSIAYNTVMLGKYGATLGKKWLKLKVVTVDGEPVSYSRALFRESIGKYLSSFVLDLGYFWAFLDKKRQAWHDKLAKTLVVETEFSHF